MNSTQVVETLATRAGDYPARRQIPTALPSLWIWCSAQPTKPTPAMFVPKFYILLQGAKRLTIAGNTVDFIAGSCAVSCVSLPFVSQVTEASSEKPYLGVELRLDAGMIGPLLLDTPQLGESEAPSFIASRVADDVSESFDRLVQLLTRPADIPILAAPLERELYYRLLQGSMGGTLRQIVQHYTRFQQIRTAAEWILANANAPMRVGDLAASVGMSATSFYRHFKAVTAYSPLAYQRHLRLLEARKLLSSGGTTVATAAFAVGYASPSQFSREYKNMFGVPPIQDAVMLRR